MVPVVTVADRIGRLNSLLIFMQCTLMSLPHSDISTRLDFVLGLYPAVARLVLGYYESKTLTVEWKADQTPVTLADRGAEELLRKHLAGRFPQDAILGEEFGETPGTSGFRWILDPVDGTKSFVSGVPLFGMLIGLQFQQECWKTTNPSDALLLELQANQHAEQRHSRNE